MGDSHLDFVATDPDDRQFGVEVKECTLTVDDVAMFPDAPTTRGIKHVEPLIDIIKGGHRAGLVILVFRPEAERFETNEGTDPAFAEAFRRAVDAGVEVHAVRFSFDGRRVRYLGQYPYPNEYEEGHRVEARCPPRSIVTCDRTPGNPS